MKPSHFLRTYGAVLLIAATFGWSLIKIGVSRLHEEVGAGVILHIAHWQLEPGVRSAFEQLGKEYEQLHPGVRIIQDAIPESTYGQWVSTQLIGATAPDIVQIGAGLLPNVWVAYMGRYFEPITQLVNQPNPYNAGTGLAGMPLRFTYKDAMREAYIDDLQEYMKVPLAQFGSRIFYNADLLKKLTGRESPPTDYREFLTVCEQIASKRDVAGKTYVPIAGSRYHFGIWDDLMFLPLTYGALKDTDLNQDGTADKDETFAAFHIGRASLLSPPLLARLKMAREVSRFFQEGYTGLTRDEGVFLFAQQRAVFITSGTWDARSLQEQARGKFSLAVMDFPRPAKDDAEFGKFMIGPLYERPTSQFAFGVTRTSKHREAALDFLLFLSSQRGNAKLNAIIGWIPAIKDTTIDPFLAPFQPHLQGIYNGADLNLGGETWVKWQQLYSLYQVNQISLEDFARQFDEFYRTRGEVDFQERKNTWRRDRQRNEQLVGGMRANAMFLSPGAGDAAWIRYRAAALSRLGLEIWQNRLLSLVGKGSLPDTPGPYKYTPEALAAVRARVGRPLPTP